MNDLEMYAANHYGVVVEQSDVDTKILNYLSHEVNDEMKRSIAEDLWDGSDPIETGTQEYRRWIAHKIVVFAMIDRTLGINQPEEEQAITFSGHTARLS